MKRKPFGKGRKREVGEHLKTQQGIQPGRLDQVGRRASTGERKEAKERKERRVNEVVGKGKTHDAKE